MLAIEPMVADPAASDGRLASEVGTAIPLELPWIVSAWLLAVPAALSNVAPAAPRTSALPTVLEPALNPTFQVPLWVAANPVLEIAPIVFEPAESAGRLEIETGCVDCQKFPVTGTLVPPLTPCTVKTLALGVPAEPVGIDPPPLPPLPPPPPVGRPEPPTKLTVVVPVEVIHVSCVAEPTLKANQPPAGMGCWAVDDDPPSAQYAVFAPTLLATTTVPEGSVPVTAEVVTAIGVPTEVGSRPPETGIGFVDDTGPEQLPANEHPTRGTTGAG